MPTRDRHWGCAGNNAGRQTSVSTEQAFQREVRRNETRSRSIHKEQVRREIMLRGWDTEGKGVMGIPVMGSGEGALKIGWTRVDLTQNVT